MTYDALPASKDAQRRNLGNFIDKAARGSLLSPSPEAGAKWGSGGPHRGPVEGDGGITQYL